MYSTNCHPWLPAAIKSTQSLHPVPPQREVLYSPRHFGGKGATSSLDRTRKASLVAQITDTSCVSMANFPPWMQLLGRVRKRRTINHFVPTMYILCFLFSLQPTFHFQSLFPFKHPSPHLHTQTYTFFQFFQSVGLTPQKTSVLGTKILDS